MFSFGRSKKAPALPPKLLGTIGVACLAIAAGMALAPELILYLLPLGFGVLGIGFVLIAWMGA